ncbi:GDP-mannose 4,6-dehydratase [Candidatus Gottesmanbacteria bacterium]|nr:GDP-mannose 4,6-dehydratase [Candidatus Gottesmanbacteria bacterium]
MKNLLITGGAGFIGSNLASFFLKKDYSVTIFDNFERKGTKQNLSWLKNQFPKLIVVEGDIRNKKDLDAVVVGKEALFHLAAQVAVTTSVTDPKTDFDINALGTFNLLESVRQYGNKPLVIFSSTNKVYGEMEDLGVVEQKTRYMYKALPYGISETTCLDFHSPYGCSKGAADQYVRDYARIYGIPTVVFRQSCIYGPNQFGIEDQGWLAWFIIALSLDHDITIYGDGKQIRDVLYIDDLVRLFDLVLENKGKVTGQIYNVGGGINNTISVWSEFGPILEKLFGKKINPKFSGWRPGDQKVYISDIRHVEKELGWKPKISVEEGISMLFKWIQINKSMLKSILFQ